MITHAAHAFAVVRPDLATPPLPAQRVAELGRAGGAQAAQLAKLESQLAEAQEGAGALASRLERAAKLHVNLQTRCVRSAGAAAFGIMRSVLIARTRFVEGGTHGWTRTPEHVRWGVALS